MTTSILLLLPSATAVMSDEKSRVGSPDRDRINVNEDYEVRYWCQAFGVTPDQLKHAVRHAGPVADVVRDTWASGRAMSLADYRRKRSFDKAREPELDRRPPKGWRVIFVVRLYHARHRTTTAPSTMSSTTRRMPHSTELLVHGGGPVSFPCRAVP